MGEVSESSVMPWVSSASLTAGMYSSAPFAPSSPQVAAITTLGAASSIRTASSGAAKPPKTTLWTAPMRAQASTETASSMTIGR